MFLVKKVGFQVGIMCLFALTTTAAFADKKCVEHWKQSPADTSCQLVHAKKVVGLCHIKALCRTHQGDMKEAKKDTTAALVEALVNCNGKLEHYWCG